MMPAYRNQPRDRRMRRREFIMGLGVAVWPLAAGAQRATMPVIGFLSARSPGESAPLLNAFRLGLKEAGYTEGQNVQITFRWAEGQYERLQPLAAELAQTPVVVIFVAGDISLLAAKAATTTIPIVFAGGSDAVKLGVVASLSRPGGNITGVNLVTGALQSKRLGLLRELVPSVTLIAMLVNPKNPNSQSDVEELQIAGRALGQPIQIVYASDERELDTALSTTLVEPRIGALIVNADPFFTGRRDQLVALMARHAVPTIYSFREFAAVGGLISYGASLADVYRKAGIYAGRILRGEKPADLPVMQPTTFELVINLKTAKALGLTIPETLLATADEVIQ
jgi:putative tryptophan/tyrosine transport system substrate-binding protein